MINKVILYQQEPQEIQHCRSGRMLGYFTESRAYSCGLIPMISALSILRENTAFSNKPQETQPAMPQTS
jgi:hypothetical protein